jgi:hypothetical protein
MSVARAFNRAWDRNDLVWADLIALGGRDQDHLIRTIPTDQLEAVLESRRFNEQIERSF